MNFKSSTKKIIISLVFGFIINLIYGGVILFFNWKKLNLFQFEGLMNLQGIFQIIGASVLVYVFWSLIQKKK